MISALKRKLRRWPSPPPKTDATRPEREDDYVSDCEEALDFMERVDKPYDLEEEVSWWSECDFLDDYAREAKINLNLKRFKNWMLHKRPGIIDKINQAKRAKEDRLRENYDAQRYFRATFSGPDDDEATDENYFIPHMHPKKINSDVLGWCGKYEIAFGTLFGNGEEKLWTPYHQFWRRRNQRRRRQNRNRRNKKLPLQCRYNKFMEKMPQLGQEIIYFDYMDNIRKTFIVDYTFQIKYNQAYKLFNARVVFHSNRLLAVSRWWREEKRKNPSLRSDYVPCDIGTPAQAVRAMAETRIMIEQGKARRAAQAAAAAEAAARAAADADASAESSPSSTGESTPESSSPSEEPKTLGPNSEEADSEDVPIVPAC